MSAIEHQLLRIARTPRLLIASDYDGVLAPIVEDPAEARPAPGVPSLLAELAAIRQTDVALISGRPLPELTALLGDLSGAGVHMVGGHGAEWPDADDDDRVRSAEHRLKPLMHRAETLLRSWRDARLEIKSASLALHYRRVAEEAAPEFVVAARGLARGDEGVRVLEGRKVIEFVLEGLDKGDALRRIRAMTSATSVLFFGDDVTDEDAFRVLELQDSGVAVNGRRRGAHFELPDVPSVVQSLERLLELRRAWADDTEPTAIDAHAILSDQRTAAVVDPRGVICWLCLPQIDSPPLFASLLGPRLGVGSQRSTSAGRFSIVPTDPSLALSEPRQSYLGHSLILTTEWGPHLRVTDYLDGSGGRPFQRAGRSDLVRVIEGRGRVRIEFAPRPDFGRVPATLDIVQGQGVVLRGLNDPVVLHAPGVSWTIEHEGSHQLATAEVELQGQPVVLELRYGTGTLRAAQVAEIDRRRQTERFWSSWVKSLSLPPVAQEAVTRSALLLKALIHGPTGAIAAAATTSLPEVLGGSRNWDYRFCWPRDASLAAAALHRLGNTGPAMRFLDWMLGILDTIGSPERLRPIYTVRGQDLGPEGEISELSGYAESRPIRIGNAAAQQVQLDVFGPVCDLAWMLAAGGAPLSADHLRLVEAMVTAVERRWRDPDSGIWEIRGSQRHYVHSKIMAWYAVDRALRVVDAMLGEDRPTWRALREEIGNEILSRGWSDSLGAFTMAYELIEFDAGALWVGLSGFLPPDDARFAATVDAVTRNLRRGKGVLRYRFDDGLPGREGGFLLCLGWLIEANLLLGRRAEAERLFQDLLECAGPLGIMAEQSEVGSHRALGNIPQAYSHVAVINAAVALSAGAARSSGAR
ncbi:MAG: trehalose-phosphatase [Phycisphaeraceae bacterium]|nr:trehalose-phosphatase [Phycisphaeraceae bacterium]